MGAKLKKDKNKYTYDGHSNPSWVWRNNQYNYDLTFDEKIELWKKESKERNRSIEAREHTKTDTKNNKMERNNRRKIAAKKKNKIM